LFLIIVNIRSTLISLKGIKHRRKDSSKNPKKGVIREKKRTAFMDLEKRNASWKLGRGDVQEKESEKERKPSRPREEELVESIDIQKRSCS